MDEKFRSAKILITGGMGFIGSNLAHRLVSMGAQVTLVDSMIPEYGGNLWNIREVRHQVQVNISDVRDEHSMKYLIHMLLRWIDRDNMPTADERYLAQSVDSQEFEVRIQALERRSP